MLPRAVTEFEGVPPRLLCRVHSNVGRAPSRISLERGVPLEEGGVPIANLDPFYLPFLCNLCSLLSSPTSAIMTPSS
jgi:hypothetical protein